MAAEARARDIRLDVFRGVAVIAMVIYHFTWDLAFFGFIDPATGTAPGFRRLGATIAGAFLFISGVSLVLMRQTIPDDPAFRRRFLRRLAIVVAAAALVSLGTWFAMGERFVRFGILHCIAVSSLLALPFLRLPAWVAFAAGAAILALPWLVDLPAFAHPALLWAGLTARVPSMVDYVPVFPFAGMALLGIAWGRGMPERGLERREPGKAENGLAWLGRWSLPIYLIHQPLLYGALFLLASLASSAKGPAADGAVDRDTA
ncbi:MAG: heparan-alpha-glucosaminide N-acetyltransferase, partial [Beijerinckiaceae bacterium]